MNILLIFPPQWIPTSPILSVAVLAGQLKRAGHKVKTLDLNAVFFNDLLCPARLQKAKEEAKRLLKELESGLSACQNSCENEICKLPGHARKKMLLLQKIKSFLTEHDNSLDTVIDGISQAVSVMRSEKDFYSPETLAQAKHTIDLALELASLPYAPNRLAFDNYYFDISSLSPESLCKETQDPRENMFLQYFEDKYAEIVDGDYDLIGVSMIDLSQLIPALTLTSLIKRKSKIPVSVGGSYISQIYDELGKLPSLFDEFFDYASFGDGEETILALADHLSTGAPIEAVGNLTYKDGHGKIVKTGQAKPVKMDALSIPCFDDYDFSLYFSPEPIFPIQLSKGCYWGKCEFCDYFFAHQKYTPKPVDEVIAEIKHHIEKYNASKFTFVDDAIPPVYYNKLALAIIENGLEISFYSFARLDSSFNSEVLSNLKKAGAKFFMWGYEAESAKILELMNKGINPDDRLKILKISADLGIWNHGLFIFGFPGETIHDIEQTMQTVKDNRDIINSCTLSNFALRKNSLLIKENSDSVSGNEIGPFYHVLKDDAELLPQKQRSKMRADFQQSLLDENPGSLWVAVAADLDHLLLYLSHFGYDYVKNYRSDLPISHAFR